MLARPVTTLLIILALLLCAFAYALMWALCVVAKRADEGQR